MPLLLVCTGGLVTAATLCWYSTRRTRRRTEYGGGRILPRRLIVDNPGPGISETYELGDVLGEGSFGVVQKAKHKVSGCTRAVKLISKSQDCDWSAFHREVFIMKGLDHTNIVKLYETYDDGLNLYLVMELCPGGELFDRICKEPFTERMAAASMRQILSAVAHMHAHRVCHLDLKPQNILMAQAPPTPIEQVRLKVTDFGLSACLSPGEVLTLQVGSTLYMAPEVFNNWYDESADVWSCGIILYVMLFGRPPFSGDTDEEVIDNIQSGRWEFFPEIEQQVTSEAKALVKRMLRYWPCMRITAQQALQHSWVKCQAPTADDVPLALSTLELLRGFQAQSRLKRAALQVLVDHLGEDAIVDMMHVFRSIDEDGDGLLSADELKRGLHRAKLGEGLVPDDLEQLVLDASQGGCRISYTDFLAATLQAKTFQERDVLWKAFCAFDLDGDGKISRLEIQKVFHSKEVLGVFDETYGRRDGVNVDEILREAGLDGDADGISFHDFLKLMGFASLTPTLSRASSSVKPSLTAMVRTMSPAVTRGVAHRRRLVTELATRAAAGGAKLGPLDRVTSAPARHSFEEPKVPTSSFTRAATVATGSFGARPHRSSSQEESDASGPEEYGPVKRW